MIPTFQRRDVVADAVRALARQDYDGAIELIIVVDGSTDGTEEALAAIPCPFPKRVMAQENRGLAATRNRGAAAATHEIILFLDDDMIAAPDLVRRHAESHVGGAKVVMGDIPLDEGSRPGFLSAGVRRWAESRAARLRSEGRPRLSDLVCGHVSIRRDLFESVGGFDEQFTAGGTFGNEDLDLAVRLSKVAEIRFNPDAVARQRYVVTPRHNLRQWEEAGRADVVFARKHPQHARDLFALHGADRMSTRLILQPLAKAVPPLADALAAVAVRFADRESHSPLLSRAAASLFRGVRDLLYWRAVDRAGGVPSERQALVLCYHAVADLSGDPVLSEYGIPPSTFASQMDALLARGFHFISPDEFVHLLAGSGMVPRRAVLLTFDDCYEELAAVAREILEPRGISGIAFAVAGMSSGTNEWDQRIGARRLQLLNAEGMDELSARGVEIGCHSLSHRPLPTLSDAALAEETRDAAERLTAIGIKSPRFFAYPHGAHDKRSRKAAQHAGFAAAFALIPARASPRSNRFAVPRIEILARDAGWRFMLKTRWPRLSPLFHPDPFPIRARRTAGRLYRRVTGRPAGVQTGL